MNKKILRSGLFIGLGLLIGILVSAIVAYSVITTKIEEANQDYGTEVHALSGVAEEAVPAIAQKDYVLAGLTLSSDFQDLLEHGVQYGWWTEEYLTQVLIDDVIPVYIDQYAGTLNIIKGTDEYEKLVDTIDGIIEKVKLLPKEEIKNLVNRLLSVDFGGIKIKIASAAVVAQNIPSVINDLKIKLGGLSGIVDKLQNADIDTTINSIKAIIGKITAIDLDEIKDSILNSDTVTSIKNLIEKITAIDLGEIKDSILNSDTVTSIKNLIEKIKGLFANVDDDFLFVAGENNILSVSFNLTETQAKILNAIDLTIVEDTYDNNGTPANLNDDTIVIGQVYIKFESSTKPGLDVVIGNITLEGKKAFLLHTNLGLINNAI